MTSLSYGYQYQGKDSRDYTDQTTLPAPIDNKSHIFMGRSQRDKSDIFPVLTLRLFMKSSLKESNDSPSHNNLIFMIIPSNTVIYLSRYPPSPDPPDHIPTGMVKFFTGLIVFRR